MQRPRGLPWNCDVDGQTGRSRSLARRAPRVDVPATQGIPRTTCRADRIARINATASSEAVPVSESESESVTLPSRDRKYYTVEIEPPAPQCPRPPI